MDFYLSSCIREHYGCDIFCIIWSKTLSLRKSFLVNGENPTLESETLVYKLKDQADIFLFWKTFLFSRCYEKHSVLFLKSGQSMGSFQTT